MYIYIVNFGILIFLFVIADTMRKYLEGLRTDVYSSAVRDTFIVALSY
jgi:hypothetical protein